jgi:hypothetical protein
MPQQVPLWSEHNINVSFRPGLKGNPPAGAKLCRQLLHLRRGESKGARDGQVSYPWFQRAWDQFRLSASELVQGCHGSPMSIVGIPLLPPAGSTRRRGRLRRNLINDQRAHRPAEVFSKDRSQLVVSKTPRSAARDFLVCRCRPQGARRRRPLSEMPGLRSLPSDRGSTGLCGTSNFEFFVRGTRKLASLNSY